jgi:hypothetical protein
MKALAAESRGLTVIKQHQVEPVQHIFDDAVRGVEGLSETPGLLAEIR